MKIWNCVGAFFSSYFDAYPAKVSAIVRHLWVIENEQRVICKMSTPRIVNVLCCCKRVGWWICSSIFKYLVYRFDWAPFRTHNIYNTSGRTRTRALMKYASSNGWCLERKSFGQWMLQYSSKLYIIFIIRSISNLFQIIVVLKMSDSYNSNWIITVQYLCACIITVLFALGHFNNKKNTCLFFKIIFLSLLWILEPLFLAAE